MDENDEGCKEEKEEIGEENGGRDGSSFRSLGPQPWPAALAIEAMKAMKTMKVTPTAMHVR